MRDIKRRLFEEYPQTRELLLPGQYIATSDIEPNREISEAFQVIVKDAPMGGQYDWIARFCKQFDLTDIELCIHRDDKAHVAISPFVTECEVGRSTVYRFDATRSTETAYLVFRYFIFPIFSLTKLQMRAIAEGHRWTGLMNMTWFCHRPRRDRFPCGTCNPCIYTIEEGLGWRIPVSSRALHVLGRLFHSPLKRRAKQVASRLTAGLSNRQRTRRDGVMREERSAGH